MTKTKLKRRLNHHSYIGSIYIINKKNINKIILYKNTTLLEKELKYKRLEIIEALNIIEKRPNSNIQDENFETLLQLYICKNSYRQILISCSQGV